MRRAEIERARRKHPENLDAYDLVLRGLAHFASVMPEDIKLAIGFLEEAIKLDPNYAVAHAYLSWCMEIRYVRGGFDEGDKDVYKRQAVNQIRDVTMAHLLTS